MKNIFKTSFHFVFLIIPLLILGACAKDITSAGESTGGGSTTGGDGDFIPDDPFANMGANPPSTSLIGTWNMTATVTESDCSDYTLGSEHEFTITIDSDGSCINDLSPYITNIDCQASESQVISDTRFFDELSTVYSPSKNAYAYCYIKAEELDSATLNSSGDLTGETKIEVSFPDESCGTSCQVTATLEGILDEDGETTGETSGSSGSGTGSEASGETSGGSGSGGESSGTESGGSGTGDGTEESTISVESYEVVKDTFFTVTVDITNNTDSENLLVDVVLQKGILSTGGPASSGPSSLPGSFGRTSTLVAKTVTVAVGTTETKTLSFKIPENLSGTYTATLRLKYVDEDEITQIVDTSETIRNLEIK